MKQYILNQHFSPKLDILSYRVTVEKTVKVPKTLYPYPNDVPMQIWSD